ncbi:MAG: hypothetical protein ACFFD6_05540 [Candidatus Thorarchaeota archaeon]
MSALRYNDETLDLEGRGVIIAKIISQLTPAPLINLYVGLIMALASPIGLGPILNAGQAILILVLVMVVSPIAPIVYSAARGRIDLDVSARESRVKFFVFSLICYAVAYIIYTLLDCLILAVLAAAYLTVTSGVMIATLKTKVSVHGAGVGGPGTALLIVYGLPAFLVVLVWAAVIWSRIVLRQHNIAQAVSGVILGVLITLPTYFFLYG